MPARLLRSVIGFLKTYIRVFRQQSIMLESAALTFVTIMGFIPFVVFTLVLIPEMVNAQANELIRKALITIFVPESAEQIQHYITQLLDRKIPLNLFNLALIFITSYSLFRIINLSFDRILNVHELKVRNFIGQMVKFFGTIIFGFLLILVVFSASSLPLVSTLFNVPFLQSFTVYIVPFMLLFLFILLGYFFIPNVRIKARTMLISASAASGAWIVVKLLYNLYIRNLTNMEVLYGVLSSIPVFLFWIYINWIIVLGGVVLVAILEDRHAIETVSSNGHRIRITFEREVQDETMSVSHAALSVKELRHLLRELIGNDDDEE
ncbi:MAG: YihY family inner membrane protein [Candidatus Cloacimonetes bacterium]|nr:YihY family inner membrane protein [Candidatus Cloacimonadota bacterium]